MVEGRAIEATRSDWRPLTAFVACSAIWSSTFLAISIGDDTVPPLWAASIRLVLATILLGIVARATGATPPRGDALRDIVLYGALQFGGNFALLYWAEQFVPSGITAVVYATIPLSTAVVAALMGVERLDPTRTATAVLGLGGVAVIFAGQLGVGVPVVGLAAVLCAATSAAVSGVFLKRARSSSAFGANAIGSAVGAAICLAGTLLLREEIAIPSTVAQWGPILYLTLAGSLGAYVLMAWLLTKWSATTTSMITVVIPVTALVLGAVVRGERPAPLAYAGAAIVMAAVVIALRRSAH